MFSKLICWCDYGKSFKCTWKEMKNGKSAVFVGSNPRQNKNIYEVWHKQSCRARSVSNCHYPKKKGISFTSQVQCSEDIPVEVKYTFDIINHYMFFLSNPIGGKWYEIIVSFDIIRWVVMPFFPSEMSVSNFNSEHRYLQTPFCSFVLKGLHRTWEILVTAQLPPISGSIKGAHCRALERHHFRIKIFCVILGCKVKVQAQ